MVRRPRGVALGIATVLGLAACTGTSAGPQPGDSSMSPRPAASATPPATSHPAGARARGGTTAPLDASPAASAAELSLAPLARIPVPTGMRVGGLTLAGSRLAWSGCLPCAGAAQDATEVYVADLPAGRPRAVGRTQFRWGSASVIGVTGDTLVWLDAADVRDGDALRSHWALRALDLRTRASWTIAEGGRPGDPAQQPVAFTRDGRVTWQLFDVAALGGPVSSADLRTRAVRAVTGQLPGLLRAVTARGLVYTSYEADGVRDADAPVLADAYLLPAGGGPASRLTADRQVTNAVASDERMLWTTPNGDNQTLWSRAVAGGTPSMVFTGPVLGFVPGRDFAAWTTRETDSVVELGNGGAPLALPDVPADGGVLAADGDRVALLTVPDRGVSGPLTLVVLRVTTRG
jgi:hypothetical protein